MRGKTKYFIIVLLLGLAISSLVGFSSWNIHVQEVFDSQFKYHENAASILEEYITINGHQIGGDNEIKAPLYKTTDNKGNSTSNADNKITCVTATGYPYSVTINDKDPTEQGSVEQTKWSKWQENGLMFTYKYYQTSEYTASKDTETDKTVWSYAALSKNVDIGSVAPKNAGGYVCIITAVTTDSATDSAKQAATNLNIATKTVNGQDFKNCAAIIEFRILQQDTSATTPVYTYQEKTAEENQNGTQSLSLRANAPYKALHTANSGLSESTVQSPATTQSGDVMTTTTREFTYGGKKYELSITANFATNTPILNGDDVTIKFDFPDGFKADNEEHRAIARIVNVKDGKENPNYNLINPFATYKIKKRFVKISEWQNLTGLTYNGQGQKPTLTLEGHSAENETGVPSSDEVYVKAVQFDTENTVYTVTDAWTNAGTYKVKALLYGDDSGNYEIVYNDGENPVKDFTIEKYSIAEPVEDGTEFVYNGTEQTYVPTIDGTSASEVKGFAADGNIIEVSANATQTNADTYKVTVKIKDNYTANYKWANTEDATTAKVYEFDFIISKRAITVTIENKESTYGEAIVDLTYAVAKNATVTDEYAAIVSGDSASDIFTLSTTATSTSDVGDYPITGTQKTEGVALNYDVTFTNNGTYNITKREITVTIEDKSSVYGDALAALTATTTDTVAKTDGLRNIISLSVKDLSGNALTSTSDVGAYAITGTQSGDKTNNYKVNFVGNYGENKTQGTYNITKREIIVTIEDKSSVYGNDLAALTATIDDAVAKTDGLRNIISLSVKDLSGNALTSTSDVGAYAITGTQSGDKTNNYTVNFVGNYGENKTQGTYVIENATITATYDLYGGENGNIAYYDGATHDVLSNLQITTVNAQTPTVEYKLSTDETFTTSIPQVLNAGAVTFTLRITAQNHGVYQQDLTVTVNKKPLTITAKNQTINKGKTPSVTIDDATYEGFVSGEAHKDQIIGEVAYKKVLTGSLDFTFVSSTDNSKVYTAEEIQNLSDEELLAADGSFAIRISGYDDADNYTINYVAGTLTVNSKTPVALPEANKDFTTNEDGKYYLVYDGKTRTLLTPAENDGYTIKVTYSAENDGYTITEETNSAQNVGTYTVTVALKDNYVWKGTTNDTSEKIFTFIISKRAITVTIENKSSVYGDAIVDLTYTVTKNATVTDEYAAIVSGDSASDIFTLSTTATSTSNVGAYAITGTQSGNKTANYDVTFTNGTYTITKAKFKSVTVTTYKGTYDGASHSLFTLEVVTATNVTITVSDNATYLSSGLTVKILLSDAWTTIDGNTVQWSSSTNAVKREISVKVSDDNHEESAATESKTAEIKKVTYSIPTATANFTYNGTAQGDAFIKALSNYDANYKYTLTFKDSSGKTIDKTKIINAEKYKVVFSLIDKTNYQWTDNTNIDKTIEWSIAKLQIKFNGTIEINYNETGFTYDESTLRGYLIVIVNGTNQLFNNYFTANGGTASTVFATADATDGNGHERALSTKAYTKVGSTYKITATATDNYEFVSNGNVIYLKYQTVYVNGNTSTYYTIEDAIALNSSTEIVLAANQSAYVETWFTSTDYYNGTEYYTLNKKDLIVPYIGADGSVVTTSTTKNSVAGEQNKPVHAVLCIPDNVTLTVGKTLNIVAYVACIYPDISKVYQRGVVMNYGKILVKSGGSVLAYGYLKGDNDGLIELESGSTTTDLFRAYDYLGGSATYTLTYTHWFPINSYSFHNISCRMKVNAGATYQTAYRIYVPSAETWTDELFLKVVSKSNDALFNLTSGHVIKYANNAARVSTSDVNALTEITGSNQIKGQKDIIELHGEVSDNTISVTVKISTFSRSITTGVNTPLPLPYMDINICNGSTLQLTSNSYKFMPGTSMTIEEGAKLITSSTSQLVFYSESQCQAEERLPTNGYSFYNSHCVDKSSTALGTYDAKLIVNGTAEIPGRVSGKILSTSSNQKASLNIGTASTQILVVESFTNVSTSDLLAGIFGTAPEFKERQTALMPAIGNLVNGNSNSGTIPYTENANLSSNTKYNSVLANSSTKTYAWYSVSGKYSITYNPNGGAMPNTYTKEVTYGQPIGTLPTPTKTGYKFLYWVDDNDNEVASTDVFYVNLNLTAEWEASTYNLTFDLDGVQGTAPSAKTVTYDNPYGDLSSPTGYDEDYIFLGWYTAIIGGTKIDSDDTVKITTNTTLYARWQVKITLNSTAGSFETGNTQTMTLTRKQTIVNNINVSPTLSGYELIGWTTDGTLESYTFDDASSVTTLTKSDTAMTPLTLYAVWEKASVQVNITFNLNYEGAPTLASQQLSSGKTITYEPAEREGYHFLGWFDAASGGNEVTTVPDANTTLYARWQVYKYTVILNSGIDGVTLSPASKEVEYGSSYNQFAVSGFTYTYEPKSLIGWEYNGKQIDLVNGTVPDLGEDGTSVTFNAVWTDNYHVVVEPDVSGAIEGTLDFYVSYKDTSCTINVSGKEITANDTRYRISGYTVTPSTATISGATLNFNGTTPGTIKVTVSTIKQYYVIVDKGSYSLTVKLGSSSGSTVSNGYYDEGTTIYIETGWNYGAQIEGGYTAGDITSNDILQEDGKIGINKSGSGTLKISHPTTIKATTESCLAKGTLVTLADGTKKKVEDLTMDDLLLVFNHETGTYDYAKLLVNEHSKDDTYKLYMVINMNFSNGSTVKVIKEHGFFDLTLNKYVYVNESNYTEFIGHKFYSASFDGTTYTSSIVTLDSVIFKQEYTAIYSPVTENGYNLFTENILSVTTDLGELLNVFEFDENMKYDEELMAADIEKYGLFTYEEVQYLMPYEVYERIPVKYYKVAIGKGLVTIEDIELLADKYMSEIVDNMNTSNSI